MLAMNLMQRRENLDVRRFDALVRSLAANQIGASKKSTDVVTSECPQG
jgi:hypothetical protein